LYFACNEAYINRIVHNTRPDPICSNIDMEICQECGGAVKVIACIEDPMVIRKILDHLKDKADTISYAPLPECRAPPAGLFD